MLIPSTDGAGSPVECSLRIRTCSELLCSNDERHTQEVMYAERNVRFLSVKKSQRLFMDQGLPTQ